MSLARTNACVLTGVRAHLVEVEAHLASGLPGLAIVGLPDTTLNESRDRVRAAVVNSGLKWPDSKITIGLSPASLRKRGSGLDVAIALAVLAASDQVPRDAISGAVVLGELGLDGRMRPVPGALAAGLLVRDRTRSAELTGELICGLGDATQVREMPDIRVTAAFDLRSLVARLRGEHQADGDVLVGDVVAAQVTDSSERAVPLPDLSEVKGQEPAKLALEIAAAGGHHLALLGRAGVGKTLLAHRLVGLLPDLSVDESLEVTSIHQLSGCISGQLIRRPPWCAPHHTATRAAIVGGGHEDRPTIGMVSLAHRGVLFLDEAAEFEPAAVDALREPLESGEVTIARSGFRFTCPARFQLVLATNPCPCGNALDVRRGIECRCTPHQRRRYLNRLSGPLMDRIDLRVVLTRPTLRELTERGEASESTATVRARVNAARAQAQRRLSGTPWSRNGDVPPEQWHRNWPLSRQSQRVLDSSIGTDSVRGRDRVARIAWTIADLAGNEYPKPRDIEVALDLRATQSEWVA